MTQEVDQLAARVAEIVRDEIAAAELRGRTAGQAAGREEGKREGQVLRDELEEKVVALTQENDRLRERLERAEAQVESLAAAENRHAESKEEPKPAAKGKK